MIRDNDFSTIRSRTYDRFDYSASRLLLKRFKQNSLYMIIIAFMLSVGVSLAIFQPGIGYEILVNGEHIGFTKNPNDIMQTLSSLDKDLRVTKGEDIKYDIDDINGHMEEAEIFSSKNSAYIMFGKNHRISIYEGYAETNTNRKVINYLNEINKFLDEKMKDDSLYQKSIKKIKSARRL